MEAHNDQGEVTNTQIYSQYPKNDQIYCEILDETDEKETKINVSKMKIKIVVTVTT